MREKFSIDRTRYLPNGYPVFLQLCQIKLLFNLLISPKLAMLLDFSAYASIKFGDFFKVWVGTFTSVRPFGGWKKLGKILSYVRFVQCGGSETF